MEKDTISCHVMGEDWYCGLGSIKVSKAAGEHVRYHSRCN